MAGQKTFLITRQLVNIVFYLILLISLIVIVIRTYRVVEGAPDLSGSSNESSLSFDVMRFGAGHAVQQPYQYADGRLAALQQPPNRYLFLVGSRSPIGYFDYFLTVLFTAAAVYGIWLLRAIFYSISIKEPFTSGNAKRIRAIGFLLIATDILKIVNYIIFDALAKRYFSGIELWTQIGSGIWLGALVLALSVVYRRGIEIHSDNQLTI